jgi:hypothetical protein
MPRDPCILRRGGVLASPSDPASIPNGPCILRAKKNTSVAPGGATAIPGAPCLLRRRGVTASPRDPASIPDGPCGLQATKNTTGPGLPTGKRQHQPLN